MARAKASDDFRSASDKLQLERLGFADLDALDKTIRESSRRELRGLIEALVFCALVTVMRQSGRKAVSKVADAIGIPSAVPGLNNLGYLLTGIAASGLVFSLCIQTIAHIFALLSGPVAKLFSKPLDQSLWPNGLEFVCAELWMIVPPIFVCLIIAVTLLVPREPTQEARYGVAGWPAAGERQQSRTRLRLQCKETQEPGDARRGAGAEELRAFCRGLAPAPRQRKRRAGAQSGNRLATLSADAPRFAARSPRGHNNSTTGKKVLVDLIRRAQVIPMLGRELIERKQCLAILGQALDRLVVFRSVFLGEDVDRHFGRSPVRRQVDLAQILLHVGLHREGDFVQDVGGLVHPTPLMPRAGKDLVERLPEAERRGFRWKRAFG